MEEKSKMENEPIGHVVPLSENDCLKLENLHLKKKMLEAQLNAILLEENEFHRQLQERLGIDARYQIDIDKKRAVKIRT
ncbi:MAG: hypothetical protein KC609_16785 [Myxococcales bacterium]|nr:hypothetical protein [Myxococcales bacterium]